MTTASSFAISSHIGMNIYFKMKISKDCYYINLLKIFSIKQSIGVFFVLPLYNNIRPQLLLGQGNKNLKYCISKNKRPFSKNFQRNFAASFSVQMRRDLNKNLGFTL